MLAEDSAEAEGVVPTDSLDGEGSQVGQNIFSFAHQLIIIIILIFAVIKGK